MNDGQILLTVVIIIALLLIFLPYIFGSLNEGKYLRHKHHKSTTFRQYPLHPAQGQEEEEEESTQHK